MNLVDGALGSMESGSRAPRSKAKLTIWRQIMKSSLTIRKTLLALALGSAFAIPMSNAVADVDEATTPELQLILAEGEESPYPAGAGDALPTLPVILTEGDESPFPAGAGDVMPALPVILAGDEESPFPAGAGDALPTLPVILAEGDESPYPAGGGDALPAQSDIVA